MICVILEGVVAFCRTVRGVMGGRGQLQLGASMSLG